jgi:hypothetical protein
MTVRSPGTLDRVAGGRWGPLRLALLLSLAGLPVAIWALVSPAPAQSGLAGVAPGLADAVLIAAIAVLGAGLAGGIAGSFLAGRRIAAPFAALAVAWATGIGLLGLAPALLGISYTVGTFCLDACNPLVSSDKPLSGITTWFGGAVLGFVTIVPVVIALVAVRLAKRAGARGSVLAPVLAALVAHTALNWLTLLGSGIPGIVVYVALCLGVASWALLLAREREPGTGSEPVAIESATRHDQARSRTG